MNLRVEFIGEKIIIHTEKKMVEYQLGTITCMISAGEWDELLQFFDAQNDYKKLEKDATDFLDKCFYSREKISKINGYMLCDSELNLSNKNYISNKKISGRMIQGKADLVVSDIYLIDSLFDLINIEMMYAVIKDMPINKCKNCNKYFVAGNAAAFYCDRIFKDGKTCKQFAGKKAFTDNLKKDEALLLYEKTYQAIYYKLRKTKSVEEAEILNSCIGNLKRYRIMYKRGDISAEEFIKTLYDYA